MSLTGSATMALVTPALTTTFIPQATTCTENRLTMLQNRAYEIWMNEPVPVPGTTFTDCYATQFMNSYLQLAGGFTQPAFNPLVCPQHYSTVGPYTSNYIACCPSGYSLHPAASLAFSDRPAFGGTCYTPLYEATPVRVTSYGVSSLQAITTYSATDENAQAYAHPYEGFAFGVAEVPSIIVSNSATTTASSSTPTSLSSATSTGSAAAATYTILANTDPVFTPNTVSAKVGDTILFEFLSGNHSITQSTFDNPCIALSGGQDSGLMTNINNTVTPTPEFPFLVTSSASQWFFSKGTGDCGAGMTFALNPTSIQTQAKFQQAAIAQGSSPTSTTSSKSSGLSTGAKAAIGVVIPLAALAAVAILLLCLRRRRRNQSKSLETTQYPTTEGYHDPSSGTAPTQDYYALRDYKAPGTESTTSPGVTGSELGTMGSSDLYGGHTSSEVHGNSAASELPTRDPVEMAGERYNRYSQSWQELESPVDVKRR